MLLVCLFGPDGSGKTTIARVLANKLKLKGLRVTVSWMRGTHTLASLLARFLSRFAPFKGSGNPYYGISVPSHARRTWQLIEFISVLPILLIRFSLPTLLGYLVVAERYAPDFVVWVSITTRDRDYLRRIEARFLLALSRRADVRVYVTASEAEIARRRGKEVDREFLSRQLELYSRVAKLIGAYRIDTTGRSVKETLNYVLNLVYLGA